MANPGLTPSEIAGRYPVEVRETNTFKTHGVSWQAANDYFKTPEGLAYLQKIIDANSGSSRTLSELKNFAVGQVRSGLDLPRMETIDEPLVKIVPRGEQVSPHTPFFARRSAFEDAIANGHNLSERFGLPIRSEAQVYDIYQIRPNGPTEVFVNTIAPTSELGGQVVKSGGAEQYLVPNRRLYSEAVHIGSIGKRLGAASGAGRWAGSWCADRRAERDSSGSRPCAPHRWRRPLAGHRWPCAGSL